MNAKGWMSLTGLLGATLAAPVAAAAPAPVAIVEEARGGAIGVAPLDYLTAGKVLHLDPKDELVLDYLNSCTREVILGGTVTVGAAGSTVVGGRIEGGKVPCDDRRRELLGEEAPPTGNAPSLTPLPKPRGQPGETGIGYTLYGRSPLIDLGGPGQLTIERLDQPEEPIKLEVAASDLLRARFYDFAKTRRSLTPGGVYRVTFGGRSIVFFVDALAQPGDTPLLGRLLRF